MITTAQSAAKMTDGAFSVYASSILQTDVALEDMTL
jgi:hypothetical protein